MFLRRRADLSVSIDQSEGLFIQRDPVTCKHLRQIPDRIDRRIHLPDLSKPPDQLGHLRRVELVCQDRIAGHFLQDLRYVGDAPLSGPAVGHMVINVDEPHLSRVHAQQLRGAAISAAGLHLLFLRVDPHGFQLLQLR